MSLKVKYWSGWIRSEQMQNAEWFQTWLKAAKEAEEKNSELVVFRIPKDKHGFSNSSMVSTIEKLLQDWFD